MYYLKDYFIILCPNRIIVHLKLSSRVQNNIQTENLALANVHQMIAIRKISDWKILALSLSSLNVWCSIGSVVVVKSVLKFAEQ